MKGTRAGVDEPLYPPVARRGPGMTYLERMSLAADGPHLVRNDFCVKLFVLPIRSGQWAVAWNV